MAEFKYSIVRYFPDPIRNEPTNVALVMHSAAERYLAAQFDLRRVASKLTKRDRETFAHFQEQLEAVENQEVDWEVASFELGRPSDWNFLETISDSVGNKIRFEAPRPSRTDDPDAVFDELFARFVSAGKRPRAGVTKRTLVRDVRNLLTEGGAAPYIKSRPLVLGEHRAYTLPLGIRHSHKTFFDVLKLGAGIEKNYRSMAAVARLWQDARRMPLNRQADLRLVLHYTNGRVQEGERLLQDDGVQVSLRPADVVADLHLDQARPWE